MKGSGNVATNASEKTFCRERKACVLILMFSLLLTGWSPVSFGRVRTTFATPAAGRAIVTVTNDTDPRDVAKTYGLHPNHLYRNAVRGFSADISEYVMQQLTTDSRVTAISADPKLHAAAQTVPTGVRRIGATPTSTGTQINADIVVLDTGIDSSHPDLNVAGGVACTGTGSWVDDNGHGTHVAGITAARDNGDGVVGVAPGARLWSVKVLDSTSYGTWSQMVCGLDWVVANASTSTSSA
jgi:subtilisin